MHIITSAFGNKLYDNTGKKWFRMKAVFSSTVGKSKELLSAQGPLRHQKVSIRVGLGRLIHLEREICAGWLQGKREESMSWKYNVKTSYWSFRLHSPGDHGCYSVRWHCCFHR